MSYNRQIALAQRLLAKYGTTATLVHYAPGPTTTFVTATVTNSGEARYPITIAVFPLPIKRGGGSADEANTLVLSAGRLATIAAKGLPVAPRENDRIEGLEGQTWIVGIMNPLGPSGVPIIYEGYLKQ